MASSILVLPDDPRQSFLALLQSFKILQTWTKYGTDRGISFVHVLQMEFGITFSHRLRPDCLAGSFGNAVPVERKTNTFFTAYSDSIGEIFLKTYLATEKFMRHTMSFGHSYRAMYMYVCQHFANG
jgi:hypothetical protein